MKKTGIYCIENVLDGKKYIGQAVNIDQRLKTHFDDLAHNCHDNPYLQNAYNKYGKDNFVSSIIMLCNSSVLSNEEIYCIATIGTKYPTGYNLTDGGDGLKNPTPEVRKKMADKKLGTSFATGHTVTKEHREIVSRSNREREVTEDTRAKMRDAKIGNQSAVGSKSRTGQTNSEETREKLKQAAKNRPPTSDETKEKLRKAQTGRKYTDEDRAKMSQIQTGNQKGLGTHRTDEQKQTIGARIKEAWDRRRQNGNTQTSEETKEKLKEAQRKRREREAEEKKNK
jgi:group I intron endonuclease